MLLLALVLRSYSIYDAVTFTFITVVCGLGCFFPAREYVRESRRRLDAPKGKLIAAIIFGIIGLVFLIPMLILWAFMLFLV